MGKVLELPSVPVSSVLSCPICASLGLSFGSHESTRMIQAALKAPDWRYHMGVVTTATQDLRANLQVTRASNLGLANAE